MQFVSKAAIHDAVHICTACYVLYGRAEGLLPVHIQFHIGTACCSTKSLSNRSKSVHNTGIN